MLTQRLRAPTGPKAAPGRCCCTTKLNSSSGMFQTSTTLPVNMNKSWSCGTIYSIQSLLCFAGPFNTLNLLTKGFHKHPPDILLNVYICRFNPCSTTTQAFKADLYHNGSHVSNITLAQIAIFCHHRRKALWRKAVLAKYHNHSIWWYPFFYRPHRTGSSLTGKKRKTTPVIISGTTRNLSFRRLEDQARQEWTCRRPGCLNPLH